LGKRETERGVKVLNPNRIGGNLKKSKRVVINQPQGKKRQGNVLHVDDSCGKRHRVRKF